MKVISFPLTDVNTLNNSFPLCDLGCQWWWLAMHPWWMYEDYPRLGPISLVEWGPLICYVAANSGTFFWARPGWIQVRLWPLCDPTICQTSDRTPCSWLYHQTSPLFHQMSRPWFGLLQQWINFRYNHKSPNLSLAESIGPPTLPKLNEERTIPVTAPPTCLNLTKHAAHGSKFRSAPSQLNAGCKSQGPWTQKSSDSNWRHRQHQVILILTNWWT